MSEGEFEKLVLSELKTLHQELQNTRQHLSREIGDVRQELKQDIQDVGQELQSVRGELKADIQEVRQEMLERFDRLERHSEENVVATLNLIHTKVGEIKDNLRSVSEVLGDHEVRIRNLTRRPV